MFISLPMLKFYISARLFTFLMSNPLFDFLYFEHVIRTKNEFSAIVLIVLGFDDVMSCISVLTIYIGEKMPYPLFQRGIAKTKEHWKAQERRWSLGRGCCRAAEQTEMTKVINKLFTWKIVIYWFLFYRQIFYFIVTYSNILCFNFL